jgi:hypothetical protein
MLQQGAKAKVKQRTMVAVVPSEHEVTANHRLQTEPPLIMRTPDDEPTASTPATLNTKSGEATPCESRTRVPVMPMLAAVQQ